MDIYHDFWIDAPASKVFEAVSTARGLDAWWTLAARAEARLDGRYELGFGPGYEWVGRVTRFEPGKEIEWILSEAAEDWQATRIAFTLDPASKGTTVHFRHLGWRGDSEHYRISSYCWAMYLRLLKRYVQHGEEVPYDERLEA